MKSGCPYSGNCLDVSLHFLCSLTARLFNCVQNTKESLEIAVSNFSLDEKVYKNQARLDFAQQRGFALTFFNSDLHVNESIHQSKSTVFGDVF